MMVKVKYFGRLRELLGVKEEEYSVENLSLTDLLIKYIPSRHPEIAEEWKKIVFVTVGDDIVMSEDGTPILKYYSILVNGLSRNLTYILRNNDEVAILPPVGGG
jgi:molybdopterin converting factor small subunit